MPDAATSLGLVRRAIEYHENSLYTIDLITCTGEVSKSRIRWIYRYHLRQLHGVLLNKAEAGPILTFEEQGQANFNAINLMRWYEVTIEGALRFFQEAEQIHAELLHLDILSEQSLTESGVPVLDQDTMRRRMIRASELKDRNDLLYEMLDGVIKLSRWVEEAGDEVFTEGFAQWKFNRSFVH